jgi:hypothetical protein
VAGQAVGGSRVLLAVLTELVLAIGLALGDELVLGQAAGRVRDCRITVDISSTDLAEELIDGILWMR